MADQQPNLIEQTVEKNETRVTEPPLYRVVLHNDDYTTKAFVIDVLVVVFHKTTAAADALMWRIHRRGSGVAGIFPREIAETKAATVTGLAREHGFPLKLSIEPDTPI